MREIHHQRNSSENNNRINNNVFSVSVCAKYRGVINKP